MENTESFLTPQCRRSHIDIQLKQETDGCQAVRNMEIDESLSDECLYSTHQKQDYLGEIPCSSETEIDVQHQDGSSFNKSRGNLERVTLKTEQLNDFFPEPVALEYATWTSDTQQKPIHVTPHLKENVYEDNVEHKAYLSNGINVTDDEHTPRIDTAACNPILNETEACDGNERQQNVDATSPTVIDSKNYICSHCHYTTRHRSALSRHMNAKHKEVSHATTKATRRLHECTECTYASTQKNNLLRHVTLKHTPDVELHACPFCNYKTKWKHQLVPHIRSRHAPIEITEGTNPDRRVVVVLHKCKQCDYTTRHVNDLRRHVIGSHTDDLEVYRCSSCDYVTKWRRNLFRHVDRRHFNTEAAAESGTLAVTHVKSPSTLYQCAGCEYTTNQRSNFFTHVKVEHDIAVELSGESSKLVHVGENNQPGLHKCTECGYTTNQSNNLFRHVIAEHNAVAEMLNCSLCDYNTKWKHNLAYHIRNKHPNVLIVRHTNDEVTEDSNKDSRNALVPNSISCVTPNSPSGDKNENVLYLLQYVFVNGNVTAEVKLIPSYNCAAGNDDEATKYVGNLIAPMTTNNIGDKAVTETANDLMTYVATTCADNADVQEDVTNLVTYVTTATNTNPEVKEGVTNLVTCATSSSNGTQNAEIKQEITDLVTHVTSSSKADVGIAQVTEDMINLVTHVTTSSNTNPEVNEDVTNLVTYATSNSKYTQNSEVKREVTNLVTCVTSNRNADANNALVTEDATNLVTYVTTGNNTDANNVQVTEDLTNLVTHVTSDNNSDAENVQVTEDVPNLVTYVTTSNNTDAENVQVTEDVTDLVTYVTTSNNTDAENVQVTEDVTDLVTYVTTSNNTDADNVPVTKDATNLVTCVTTGNKSEADSVKLIEGVARLVTCVTTNDVTNPENSRLSKDVSPVSRSSTSELQKCSECSYSTEHRGNFFRHLRRKHNIDAEVTMNNSGVRFRSHHVRKLHSCPHCNYTTNQKSNLSRHLIAKHRVDVQIYECPLCNYKTNWKPNLTLHIRRHKNAAIVKRVKRVQVNPIVKVYECTQCSYMSEKNGNLLRHVRAKHKANAEIRNAGSFRTLHKCNECAYASTQSNNLIRHVAVKHSTTSDVYKCALCRFTTKWPHNVFVHARKKHQLTRRLNNILQRLGKPDNSDMPSRQMVESDDTAKDRSLYTTKQDNFILPCEIDLDSEPHKCPQCEFVAAQKSHLVEHLSTTHDSGAELLACTECTYTTKWRHCLSYHVKAKHDPDSVTYKCATCPYKSIWKSNLVLHIRRRHANIELPEEMTNLITCVSQNYTPKVRQCAECSYTTNKSNNLVRHVKARHRATAEVCKSSPCDYEAKLFVQEKEHGRAEITEQTSDSSAFSAKKRNPKRHKCTNCDYSTNQKSNLRRHSIARHEAQQMTRIRAKPIIQECTECGYMSKNKSNFTRHVRTKHSSFRTLHKCNECPYTSTQSNNLLRHVALKHSTTSDVYKCALCRFTSKWPHNVFVHARKRHKLVHPLNILQRLGKLDNSDIASEQSGESTKSSLTPQRHQSHIEPVVIQLKQETDGCQADHDDQTETDESVSDERLYSTHQGHDCLRDMASQLETETDVQHEDGSSFKEARENLERLTVKTEDQMDDCFPEPVTLEYTTWTSDTEQKPVLVIPPLKDNICEDNVEHKQHFAESINDPDHTCTNCDCCTNQKSNLERHSIAKHKADVELHKCSSCNYKTKWKRSLILHVRKHKNDENAKQMTRIKVNPIIKVHECTECGYMSEKKDNLTRHVRTKHSVNTDIAKCARGSFRTFSKCNECAYTSTQSNNVLRHVATKHSTTSDVYKCALCRFASKRPHNVFVHARKTHKHTNPFNILQRRGKLDNSDMASDRSVECADTTKQKNHAPTSEATKTAVRRKRHKCPQCNFTTNEKWYLTKHLTVMHGSKAQVLACAECSYTTKWKHCLSYHVKAKHCPKSETYECATCTYKSTWKCNLVLHMIRKHAGVELPDQMTDLGTRVPQKLAAKLRKCAKCSYITNKRNNLIRHVKAKHKPRPDLHERSLHDYGSKRDRELVNKGRHKRTGGSKDDDARRHKCANCDYSTNQKSNLRRHSKAKHNVVLEAHQCSLCNYKTKWKYDLALHLGKHENAVVAKGFNQAGIGHGPVIKTPNVPKQKHVVKRDADPELTRQRGGSHLKLHRCPECNYTSNKSNNLRRHVVLKHSTTSDVYTCTLCDYTSKWPNIVLAHARKKHELAAPVNDVRRSAGKPDDFDVAPDQSIKCGANTLEYKYIVNGNKQTNSEK